MLRTKQPARPHNRDLSLEPVIIYAEIVSRNALDKLELYQLKIEEFYYSFYDENVFNEETQQMEVKTFSKKEIIIQPNGSSLKDLSYSFEQADQLSDVLDQMYNITETKSARRAKYAKLGHLITNNQDNIYGVEWELVTE